MYCILQLGVGSHQVSPWCLTWHAKYCTCLFSSLLPSAVLFLSSPLPAQEEEKRRNSRNNKVVRDGWPPPNCCHLTCPHWWAIPSFACIKHRAGEVLKKYRQSDLTSIFANTKRCTAVLKAAGHPVNHLQRKLQFLFHREAICELKLHHLRLFSSGNYSTISLQLKYNDATKKLPTFKIHKTIRWHQSNKLQFWLPNYKLI